MGLRVALFIAFYFSCQICYSQNNSCATIDKYNAAAELSSSHTAVVMINRSILENILWIDSTMLDTAFFGTMTFYGDSGTFNDKQGVQYRINLNGDSADCFENVIAIRCKKLETSGQLCNKLTDSESGFCWRH